MLVTFKTYKSSYRQDYIKQLAIGLRFLQFIDREEFDVETVSFRRNYRFLRCTR